MSLRGGEILVYTDLKSIEETPMEPTIRLGWRKTKVKFATEVRLYQAHIKLVPVAKQEGGNGWWCRREEVWVLVPVID